MDFEFTVDVTEQFIDSEINPSVKIIKNTNTKSVKKTLGQVKNDGLIDVQMYSHENNDVSENPKPTESDFTRRTELALKRIAGMEYSHKNKKYKNISLLQHSADQAFDDFKIFSNDSHLNDVTKRVSDKIDAIDDLTDLANTINSLPDLAIKKLSAALSLNVVEILKTESTLRHDLANDAKKYNVLLHDEFGREKARLRLEVEILVARAEKGEIVAPNYMRGKRDGKWSTPLEYLELVWGKYLSQFNGTKDYLFQFDLDKLDSRLKRTLTSYLRRMFKDEKGTLSFYIPSKTKFLELKYQNMEYKDFAAGVNFFARKNR